MTHRLGYLPAPYKGRLASIFQKLMRRYSECADIEQGDVQMLVWGCRRRQPSSESLLDREHYLHGIRDAIRGTPAERVEWIAETHQNAAEALGEAIIVLDRLPTESYAEYEPTGYLATPGSSGGQRLLVSGRVGS
jgi:hypothetical protein